MTAQSPPDPPSPLPPRPQDSDQARLRLYFIVLSLSLTLFIIGLCALEYWEARLAAIEQAETDCRSTFNKDLVYRRWAAGHGGVYVPITETTPPNPYLEHIAERDITTPSGKRLTLMNPAYMTRQVFEMGKIQYGAQGHLTSLKPIRPENAPDAWEAKALQDIAAGAKEVVAVEMLGAEAYVRMIRPMKTEEGCLKCHAQQGYKLGDIRGGISVSVPIAPYLAAALNHASPVFWGYGIIWALGLTGFVVTKNRFHYALLIRREGEDDLRASEARYKDFFESNSSTMLVIDPASGDIVDANPAASAFYGWSRDELRAKKISELNISTPEEIASAMTGAKTKARTHFIFQHRLADETVRDVEVYTGPLLTPTKNLLFSIVHDISDRLRTEKALHDSEEFLRETQEVAGLGTYDLDIITGQWQSSEILNTIFGIDKYFARTLYGWRSIIHPEDRQMMMDYLTNEVIGQHQGFDKEYRIIRPSDRAERWLHGLGRLEFDAQGHPVRMIGTVRDITERKLAEDKLRRSLQEKEVMLKEIHHRVKNNMQVIYSLLNLQASSIKDATVRAMFEESKNRINSMAIIHEKLYRSKDFAFIDFKEYLQGLVVGIAETYKRHDIVFTVEMGHLALDVNVGVPCGLIVNELVSNCLKHAFPEGRQGTVTLGVSRDREGHNILTVADNGIGLPLEIDFRNTQSLGLQLVSVLSGQLHGTIELSRDKGTKFTIIFPGS